MCRRSVKAALAPLDNNTDKSLFARAMRYAKKLHAFQVDKAGEPYYKHLARVSMRCESPMAKVVALLHDTLEDTSVTYDQLRMRFGAEIADAVKVLTHMPDEPYFDYIGRVSDHPIALEVKIADLIDNSNLSRLPTITLKDVCRQRRYNQALYILTAIKEDT